MPIYIKESKSDLTDNTGLSGNAQNNGNALYYAFDGKDSTYWESNVVANSYIIYDFGEANEKIISKYILQSPSTQTYMIKNWTLEGSNDKSSYTVLDTQTNITWSAGEKKEFIFDNSTPFRYYKINVSANNGGSYTRISEISYYSINSFDKILLLNMDSKVVGFENIDTPYITKMTSNTAPSPLKASASSIAGSGYEAFRAFDGNTGTTNASWVTLNPYPTGWIALDFGEFRKVSKVKLTSWNNSSAKTHSPKDFLIEGSNDGSKWTTLKEIVNETDWIANETREYSLGKTHNYKMYRINITKNNGAVQSGLGEIQFIRTDKFIKQLPTISKNNFINHGLDGSSISNFDVLFSSKKYVLQDTVSEDTDGLWKTQITRKPLSIRFD